MLRALIFDFDGLIVDTESSSLSVQAVGGWLAAASGSRQPAMADARLDIS